MRWFFLFTLFILNIAYGVKPEPPPSASHFCSTDMNTLEDKHETMPVYCQGNLVGYVKKNHAAINHLSFIVTKPDGTQRNHLDAWGRPIEPSQLDRYLHPNSRFRSGARAWGRAFSNLYEDTFGTSEDKSKSHPSTETDKDNIVELTKDGFGFSPNTKIYANRDADGESVRLADALKNWQKESVPAEQKSSLHPKNKSAAHYRYTADSKHVVSSPDCSIKMCFAKVTVRNLVIFGQALDFENQPVLCKTKNGKCPASAKDCAEDTHFKTEFEFNPTDPADFRKSDPYSGGILQDNRGAQ